MKALKHIYQQPFIFATGIAALMHSTWALGTLFAGIAPEPALTWAYISWIVPAFLIAFALDVGQISTSGQIRDKGMTLARGFTFLIFALATYYLQWLYMAVHMPLLEISAGVTGVHYDVAVMLRNVGIWLIPALLPISTVSYTFSSDDNQSDVRDDTPIEQSHDAQISIFDIDVPILETDTQPLLIAEHPTFDAMCDCGWSRTYDNADSMQRGLNAHQQKCSYLLDIAGSEVSA